MQLTVFEVTLALFEEKISTNFVRKLYGKLVRKLILLMDSSFYSYIEDKLKSFYKLRLR